jgi:hypothetical protein
MSVDETGDLLVFAILYGFLQDRLFRCPRPLLYRLLLGRLAQAGTRLAALVTSLGNPWAARSLNPHGRFCPCSGVLRRRFDGFVCVSSAGRYCEDRHCCRDQGLNRRGWFNVSACRIRPPEIIF